MKKKSGIGMVMLLVLVAGITAMITYTFSRYTSTATGTDTAQIAPWVVKVNGTDITETNVFTGNDIEIVKSNYISEGYMAPSSVGEISLVLDPTGSQVAMEYEIAIEIIDLYSIQNIEISYVKVNGTTLDGTTGNDGKIRYNDIISLADVQSGTVQNIKIGITWTDYNTDEANEEDTYGGTTVAQAVGGLPIPITITATQYLG